MVTHTFEPSTMSPRDWRVTVRHLVTLFVWAVIITAILYFFGPWKLVLLGLLAAACLASMLAPVLDRLPGPRPVRGLLLGIVPILVCGGLLFVAAWLLVDPVKRELAYLPQAEANFNHWLAAISTRIGMQHPLTTAVLFSYAGRYFGGSGFFGTLSGALIDIGIGIVFVFVGNIYMLAEPSERVIPTFITLLPPARQTQALRALKDLEPRLRWWLIGALITATIIGLTSWLGFWIIGLQLAIPLAILAGISEFVPTIGPMLAFLVALAFAATQGMHTVLWLLCLYAVVHVLESYVLIPIVYKRAVRIPPVVTLFSVVLWGEIFGIGGLLLAVPINLFLWTMAEHFIGRKGDTVMPDQVSRVPALRNERIPEAST